MSLFLQHLWCHVLVGPTVSGPPLEVIFLHLGRPREVTNFHNQLVIVVFEKEQILWFQVSVHIAMFVHVVKANQGLDEEVSGVALGAVLSLLNPLKQIAN